MKFKNKDDMNLFFLLHPALIMIYADLNWYAKKKFDVDLVITQTLTSKEIDTSLNRVSSAHRSGLAIDVRTKNLPTNVISDLCEYLNSKEEYKEYQYLSRSGINRLAYYHIGNEEHIHIAIHSKFANYRL